MELPITAVSVPCWSEEQVISLAELPLSLEAH
jgi:hypothetical protein